MKSNVPTAWNDRGLVVTYLALLSSDAARDALGRLIPPERLAYELCRIWFDEIFIAGHRYFDGLKGDFSQEAADRFRNAFTDEELAAIERFSRFLELRLEMLSNPTVKVGRIPDNDAWRSLVRDAGYLLDDLDPEGPVRRRRLAEWLVDRMATESPGLRRLIELTIKRSED